MWFFLTLINREKACKVNDNINISEGEPGGDIDFPWTVNEIRSVTVIDVQTATPGECLLLNKPEPSAE